MDIERLKQSALVPLGQPRVVEVFDFPQDLLDAINELIAELNAEGYPVTIDHIAEQALTELFERPNALEELARHFEEQESSL
jgi:hypothetical protein